MFQSRVNTSKSPVCVLLTVFQRGPLCEVGLGVQGLLGACISGVHGMVKIQMLFWMLGDLQTKRGVGLCSRGDVGLCFRGGRYNCV